MSDTMRLTDLIRNYCDGNEVGWGVEFEWLRQNSGDATMRLLHLIKRDGIQEPILLGNDGRVWDGHHRIYVAFLLRMGEVPVEYAA